MLLESAWTNFVSSAQDTPLQTYSFLAHRIQAGPMTRMPPARLGRRDGWALMLHQLLLNAQELLEEQWQISKVPKRLFGYRLTRWAATIALIVLSFVVCVARRVFIGISSIGQSGRLSFSSSSSELKSLL